MQKFIKKISFPIEVVTLSDGKDYVEIDSLRRKSYQ